ncbi:MAG: hypothetical protein WCP85_28225 [Mariniphaga sp.]
MANELSKKAQNIFEQTRRVDENNNEYWSGRELGKILEYSEFRHFKPVIEKAREACRNSGQPVENHFEVILEMVKIGSGAERPFDDGVIEPVDYAIFQNHGYKGLYGGLDAKGIHERKGLKKSQHILDHMGSTELAANLFRATQTEDKLRRENIRGKTKANQTHFEVGKKVRQTIKELGGTMPENLPTEENIKQIENKEKKKLE